MRNTLSALTFAVLALSAGHVLAQDPGGAKTREQVRTELMEAIRTGNPMYSFIAIGKRAGDFFHWDNKDAYGSPSPFSWLRNPDVRGKIAVIDLDDQRSMTFYHHVEEVMRVKYRYYKDFPGKWTGWDGVEQDKTYKLYVRDLTLGWHTNVNPMGELLWRKEIWKGNRPGEGDGMRVCLAEDVFFMTQQIIIMGYEMKYLGYLE
jgi:aminoglycoside 3-N-acetyltransferase